MKPFRKFREVRFKMGFIQVVPRCRRFGDDVRPNCLKPSFEIQPFVTDSDEKAFEFRFNGYIKQRLGSSKQFNPILLTPPFQGKRRNEQLCDKVQQVIISPRQFGQRAAQRFEKFINYGTIRFRQWTKSRKAECLRQLFKEQCVRFSCIGDGFTKGDCRVA